MSEQEPERSAGRAPEVLRTLKRRHLVQITLVYLGSAWVFIEAVGFFHENYGMSRKVLDVVILLTILGFPAVLLIGWFHGERGSQRVTRTELWLITTLVVLASIGTYRITAAEDVPPGPAGADPDAGLTAGSPALLARGGGADLGAGSVAILPFTNHVADTTLAWLGPGLADMLTTNFAQNPELRVIGRQRLFDLMTEAGHQETEEIPDNLAFQIAGSAGARLMVRGSITGSAADLAIDAQLIELRDGTVLAAERARGTDVFALVDTVSTSLMSRLATGRPVTAHRPRRPVLTTRNLEAFQAFYEGIQAEREHDAESAETHFRVAVELDSTFSLAWTRLASMEESEADRQLMMDRAMGKAENPKAFVLRLEDLEPGGEEYVAAIDSLMEAKFDLMRAAQASAALSEVRAATAAGRGAAKPQATQTKEPPVQAPRAETGGNGE